MTRGEVALIVAQKGLSAGLLEPVYFTSVILLIIVSSISTPIILKYLYSKDKEPENIKIWRKIAKKIKKIKNIAWQNNAVFI